MGTKIKVKNLWIIIEQLLDRNLKTALSSVEGNKQADNSNSQIEKEITEKLPD